MTYIIWHILYDIYYILYDMSGCHNKWMLSFDVLIIRFIRSSSWILRWCTSWIDWKIGSKLKPMNEFGKPQRWRPRMSCLGTAMGSSKPPIDFRHLWVCCRTDVLAFCPHCFGRCAQLIYLVVEETTKQVCLKRCLVMVERGTVCCTRVVSWFWTSHWHQNWTSVVKTKSIIRYHRYHYWLVVWNIFLFFHSVGNVIIPTDFHIFQRGGSTTNQIRSVIIPISGCIENWSPLRIAACVSWKWTMELSGH